MKRPLLKSASKRTSVRLREKIKKKVAEHGRKTRKLQKSQKTKKQTVPQNAPFKDEILNAAAEFQEIKRAKVTAKKLAKKENKIKMKGKSISDIMKNVQKAHSSFDKKQIAKDQVKEQAFMTDAKKAAWFRRELNSVVEKADVILQVVDARDPNGCRCPQLEEQALAKGKRVVLVMNKVDLVPKPIVKQWLEVLRRQLPTVSFKASTQKQRSNIGRSHNVHGATAYGADELTKVLAAFSRRRGMKTGITAAVVGFPNVGKSSVINSLTRSRSCIVSAVAGSTRTTQEVSIDKMVKLLDSPGVLFGGSTEKQAMRGALTASALADPVEGAIALLDRCDQVALSLHYNTQHTSNPRAFLALLAQKRGLVKKGGIPDCEQSARQILQDCQRGKFSFYTRCPKTAEGQLPPDYLADSKLVSEMNAEFEIDQLDSWMESTELPAPTSGAAIGMRNDGYADLEDLEEESDQENEQEMEGDAKEEAMEHDDISMEFPEKKVVHFSADKKSVDSTDLRKKQKDDKQKLKRKDKFETKLSDNLDAAMNLM